MRLPIFLGSVAVLAACSNSFDSSGGGGAGGGGSGAGGGKTSPADVAGEYTVAATNGVNPCQFANWTQGQVTQGISFTITQQGKNATGVIGGTLGDLVNLILGSDQFIGSVKGDALTLTDYGTTTGHQNGCSYSVNAEIDGTLDGDAIQGTIGLTPSTNGSPDCGVLDHCTSVVKFSGSRPPK